ncbi:hypothetical protein N7U49_04945 [Streptomyces sp. AD2-2]|nr:hypothetical protein N7U49_04945 [Streptomyces sp. AD2-2]
MTYVLQAVIARVELLRASARNVSDARVASLGQGLSLLPMTDEVFDAVTDGSGASPSGSGGCRAASTGRSPSGPPEGRSPMWRPSTSAEPASNEPPSGLTERSRGGRRTTARRD